MIVAYLLICLMDISPLHLYMLMTLSSLGLIQKKLDALKAYLHQQFSIKDLGKLNYFLVIEVAYTSEGIILSQKKVY